MLSSTDMPAIAITCSTPGVSSAILVDLSSAAVRAAERGAVGQLHGDHQIALVLVRDERGRQPGDAPDADAADQASAISTISPLRRTIRPISAA